MNEKSSPLSPVDAILIEDIPAEFSSEVFQWLNYIIPDSSVIAMERDPLGLKVYFGKYRYARVVIEKRFITVEDKKYQIFPLVSNLTVHDVRGYVDECTLSNYMEPYGRVLQMYPITYLDPLDPTKTLLTNNYRVILEIPEIKERYFYPENLNIPGIDKTFRVTNFCRLCRQEGHTQHNCVRQAENADFLASEQHFQQSRESRAVQEQSSTLGNSSFEDMRNMFPMTDSRYVRTAEINTYENSAPYHQTGRWLKMEHNPLAQYSFSGSNFSNLIPKHYCTKLSEKLFLKCETYDVRADTCDYEHMDTSERQSSIPIFSKTTNQYSLVHSTKEMWDSGKMEGNFHSSFENLSPRHEEPIMPFKTNVSLSRNNSTSHDGVKKECENDSCKSFKEDTSMQIYEQSLNSFENNDETTKFKNTNSSSIRFNLLIPPSSSTDAKLIKEFCQSVPEVSDLREMLNNFPMDSTVLLEQLDEMINFNKEMSQQRSHAEMSFIDWLETVAFKVKWHIETEGSITKLVKASDEYRTVKKSKPVEETAHRSVRIKREAWSDNEYEEIPDYSKSKIVYEYKHLESQPTNNKPLKVKKNASKNKIMQHDIDIKRAEETVKSEDCSEMQSEDLPRLNTSKTRLDRHKRKDILKNGDKKKRLIGVKYKFGKDFVDARDILLRINKRKSRKRRQSPMHTERQSLDDFITKWKNALYLKRKLNLLDAELKKGEASTAEVNERPSVARYSKKKERYSGQLFNAQAMKSKAPFRLKEDYVDARNVINKIRKYKLREQHDPDADEAGKSDQEEDINRKMYRNIIVTEMKSKPERDKITQYDLHSSLQNIVRNTPGVLTAKDMTAFLKQVKIRHHPILIARYFTENVKGILIQLKDIIKKYFRSGVRGREEDNEVRRLVNLEKRLIEHEACEICNPSSINNKKEISNCLKLINEK